MTPSSRVRVVQNDTLPPLRRTDRVAIPSWAVAEDKKALVASQRKRDDAMSLRDLHDRHFSDIEGNIRIEKARSAVLASRLKPPKGWGAQHTHVSVSSSHSVWPGTRP